MVRLRFASRPTRRPGARAGRTPTPAGPSPVHAVGRVESVGRLRRVLSHAGGPADPALFNVCPSRSPRGGGTVDLRHVAVGPGPRCGSRTPAHSRAAGSIPH